MELKWLRGKLLRTLDMSSPNNKNTLASLRGEVTDNYIIEKSSRGGDSDVDGDGGGDDDDDDNDGDEACDDGGNDKAKT